MSSDASITVSAGEVGSFLPMAATLPPAMARSRTLSVPEAGSRTRPFWRRMVLTPGGYPPAPALERVKIAPPGGRSYTPILTFAGCSAAWLARLTGGQEVGGSNPPTPTCLRAKPFDEHIEGLSRYRTETYAVGRAVQAGDFRLRRRSVWTIRRALLSAARNARTPGSISVATAESLVARSRRPWSSPNGLDRRGRRGHHNLDGSAALDGERNPDF